MGPEQDPIERLAGSVSDGAGESPSDADLAGADAQEEIAALREVSRIAEFNRRLQRSAAADPAAATDHADLDEPRRWGSLLLLEPLGSGATGEVWRAWDLKLEREVALKFLQPHAGAQGNDALIAEARALARVRHPGVVAVHGVDLHDGRAGLWMERLQGGTLAGALERGGALAIDEVIRIGRETAQALAAVHDAGLVHGDVKPSNVMLEPGGRVVLTDFGLGRRTTAAAQEWRMSGTPYFMAPETLRGAPVTPQADLYALGVTLRWALTGRCPFEARSLEALRREAASGPARPLAQERADAPASLTAAITRAMDPDPDARFARAAELAQALDAKAGPPAAATPARGAGTRLALAAALLPVIALFVWLAWPRGDGPPPEERIASPAPAPAEPAVAAYDVEATLLRRSGGGREALAQGDRVRPGDQLSLEFQATREAWVYVLNEDERGEVFLLFPQPLYDLGNPIPRGAEVTLPGTIDGVENAWTVSSRGQREHFLVVASPHPLDALEAELARLPGATQERSIQYAPVPAPAVEVLRGIGAVTPVAPAPGAAPAGKLDQFASLAGRETQVSGVWVRRVTLENPLR